MTQVKPVGDYAKPKVGKIRRGDFEAANKLAIGICTLGVVRIETVIPMMMTGMPLGQAQLFVIPVGYSIQDARNIAWNIADGDKYEYFMFWDDDVMPLGTGFVETLLETMEQNPEIDILGGIYPARQNIPIPIVIKDKDGPPWWGWEDGGIHRVWMTGTGFTMYRMESVNRINAPVKTFEFPNGNWDVKQYFWLDGSTDDYMLAAEAEKLGLKWYVHGKVICDQIEPSGFRFEVKNARHRIQEGSDGADKSATAAGKDANGHKPVGPRKGKRPAHVRAG